MTPSTKPVLGRTAQQLADAPDLDVVATARDRWTRYRFAEVPDAVDADWLRQEAAWLWRELRPIAEPVLRTPQVVEGRLVDGMRYKRVDPGRPRLPDAVKAPMLDVYARFDLQAWGATLSSLVEPMVAAVLGDSVTYDRVYFLLYEHDDYIAPHNDVQTGPRVNVQFPLTVGGLAGLRVLDWTWHTYPDNAGLLRILGPEVWHEVLPLLGSPDAYRLNISLRYWLRG